MKNIDILFCTRDDHAFSSLFRDYDDGEHCTMQLVHTGRAALDRAQRYAPDILVIDSVLLDLDGLAVVDRMQASLGGRMPRVIAGIRTPMARAEFARRGAYAMLDMPWREAQLHRALDGAMGDIDTRIDWDQAQGAHARAAAHLIAMGMRPGLHGFEYLAWAAALCCQSENRLFAINERVYAPIAKRFGTSPQNVERLIRHAVESTMDAGRGREVYGFFGNTIDPTRGKPTNAQMLAALSQHIRG